MLPLAEFDLVSYSAWESTVGYPDRPEMLRKALDVIAANTSDSPDFGAGNVYVGEYGLPENDFDSERLRKVIAHTTRTALDWGCPYVLYWQIFCNEPKQGSEAEPPITKNEDARGFCLIRPDGSKSWAWGYLKELLGSNAGTKQAESEDARE